MEIIALFKTINVEDASIRDKVFNKSDFTNRFCKVELGLKSTFYIILESILTRLLGLSGHPLSDRYRIIITYKFHV